MNNSIVQLVESVYNSSGRYYHNMIHINKMRQKLYELIMQHPEIAKKIRLDEFNTAILFHDIVQGEGHEEQSAYIAELLLKDTDLNVPYIQTLIRATDYSKKAVDTFGEQLIRDLDLMGLGKSKTEYWCNRSLVRKEYNCTDEEFIEGRKKFIEHFLSFDKIFETEYFTDLEEKARKNLERELKRC